MNLHSLQANGMAMPFAETLRYHRVTVLFQSADDVAVILIN